ncbi:hypothetical protein D9M68_474140 [compost metagenome]
MPHWSLDGWPCSFLKAWGLFETLGELLAEDHVRDAHVRMSLQLQQVSCLRREESMKFQPNYLAHRLAGAGSLIPAHKSFIQQRHVYDGQCKAAGLSHMHGLRHRYAQQRYEALTGWKAPAAGGPSARSLTPAQRAMDTQARQAISRELGHERAQITAVYLGR